VQQQKKPPEGGFFWHQQMLTWKQRKPVRQRHQKQPGQAQKLRKQPERVQERGPEPVQQRVPEPVLVRALQQACHRRPVQQQR